MKSAFFQWPHPSAPILYEENRTPLPYFLLKMTSILIFSWMRSGLSNQVFPVQPLPLQPCALGVFSPEVDPRNIGAMPIDVWCSFPTDERFCGLSFYPLITFLSIQINILCPFPSIRSFGRLMLNGRLTVTAHFLVPLRSQQFPFSIFFSLFTSIRMKGLIEDHLLFPLHPSAGGRPLCESSSPPHRLPAAQRWCPVSSPHAWLPR